MFRNKPSEHRSQMAMSVIHSSEAGGSSSSSSSSSNSGRTGGAVAAGEIITSSRPFHYASANSASTMSLVSRLDRLDYMMKFLDEKREGGRTRSATRSGSKFAWMRKNVPLDLAVEDARSGGSLLDRVVALENQLTQLCLEMDSRGASFGGQTSELHHDASSSKPYGGKGGFPLSLPKIWTNSTSSRSQHHLQKKQLVNSIKSSADQHDEKEPSKHEAPPRQSRKTKEQISSSIRPKKTAPPTWLHLRFLRC